MLTLSKYYCTEIFWIGINSRFKQTVEWQAVITAHSKLEIITCVFYHQTTRNTVLIAVYFTAVTLMGKFRLRKSSRFRSGWFEISTWERSLVVLHFLKKLHLENSFLDLTLDSWQMNEGFQLSSANFRHITVLYNHTDKQITLIQQVTYKGWRAGSVPLSNGDAAIELSCTTEAEFVPNQTKVKNPSSVKARVREANTLRQSGTNWRKRVIHPVVNRFGWKLTRIVSEY